MKLFSLALLFTLPALSQQFDAASIKPNTTGERAVKIGYPSPGRLHAENVWLRFLIQNAWNVKDYQISNAPAWASADRFDLDAKTDHPASRDELRLMLQTLLEDRFHLVLHRETRSLPIYHLVPAKNGSKLRPSEITNCDAPDCGSSQFSPHSVIATHITMPQFTTMLANILQRPVVDETGFTAPFDVHLEWTADQATPGLMAPGVTAPPPSPDDPGATIFTALTEHLGLKLQPAKGPVDILVIDQAAKPSPN